MIKSVLMICNTVWPFYKGGYERRYFEIARRLARYGIEVTILTSIPESITLGNLRFKKVLYFDTFFTKGSTRSFGKELTFMTKLSLKLINELKVQYDIVDVNQTPPIHIIPSKVYEYLRKVPLVCTIHEELSRYIKHYAKLKYGNSLGSLISYFMTGTYLQIMRICRNFIVVSKVIIDQVKRLYGGNVYYVPNGIDLSIIDMYKSKKSKRDVLAMKNRETVITFIGRLVIEKRPHWAIKLAKDLIRDGYHDFVVYIIGDGPMHNRLIDLINKYDVRDKVMLMGKVCDRVKYTTLSITDIFILPSIREGFSIATLEAMAFAIPPVVTCMSNMPGISGHLEYVKHNFNGFIASNYSEFKNYVLRLINDSGLRRKLGRNAEETARKYDWDNIVRKLIEVYDIIASG